ncbi:hypothetical protein GUITHDRAFT_155642, partial [Guillardia theta CCMP2712]
MKRIRLACKPCKDARLKCDNLQPCSRCTRLNIGESCIRTMEEKEERRRGCNSCITCKIAKAKCDEGRPCGRCKRLRRDSRCIYEELQPIQPRRLDEKEQEEEAIEEQETRHLRKNKKQNSMPSEHEAIAEGQAQEIQDVQQLSLPPDHPARWQQLQVERPIDFWIRSLSFDRPSLLREHMNSMGWPDRVLARHWEFGFSSKELMNIFVSLPPYLQQVTRRALHAIEIIMADKMEKKARTPQAKLL